MAHEPTYGSLFVTHLTKLGRHVPYNYQDLQQVKGMSRAELADWIQGECRDFSAVIRDNSAEVAAEMVHKRRTEMAAGPSAAAAAECTLPLLELLSSLFS